jgi:hypothetical protein
MQEKKRIDTLRILIDGHRSLTGSAKLAIIMGELNRIPGVSGRSDANGRLLKVLHTTRFLDTTLNEVLRFKRWQITKPSLGSYITTFLNKGILRIPERQRFMADLVRKRNFFMHEAGAMPTQADADKVLSEMHACVAIILARL